MTIDKKSLSERDICTKFITPALRKASWDEMAQGVQPASSSQRLGLSASGARGPTSQVTGPEFYPMEVDFKWSLV